MWVDEVYEAIRAGQNLITVAELIENKFNDKVDLKAVDFTTSMDAGQGRSTTCLLSPKVASTRHLSRARKCADTNTTLAMNTLGSSQRVQFPVWLHLNPLPQPHLSSTAVCARGAGTALVYGAPQHALTWYGTTQCQKCIPIQAMQVVFRV